MIVVDIVHCLACDGVFIETLSQEGCPHCGAGADDSVYLNPEGEDWKYYGEGYDEVCPSCGTEIQVSIDGKTTCPKCGHKNVLPCSMCPKDYDQCDWTEDEGCSVFNNK